MSPRLLHKLKLKKILLPMLAMGIVVVVVKGMLVLEQKERERVVDQEVVREFLEYINEGTTLGVTTQAAVTGVKIEPSPLPIGSPSSIEKLPLPEVSASPISVNQASPVIRSPQEKRKKRVSIPSNLKEDTQGQKLNIKEGSISFTIPAGLSPNVEHIFFWGNFTGHDNFNLFQIRLTSGTEIFFDTYGPNGEDELEDADIITEENFLSISHAIKVAWNFKSESKTKQIFIDGLLKKEIKPTIPIPELNNEAKMYIGTVEELEISDKFSE